MELQLKHIAPYLPYEVKVINAIGKENYLTLSNVSYHFENKAKLILRTLNDITSEIEHNGEKFVPLEKLRKKRWGKHLEWMGENKTLFPNGYHLLDGFTITTDDYSIDIELEEVCYIKEWLIEWHFDIHNLIPEGLAIDINTL